jgi:hypothetical protein
MFVFSLFKFTEAFIHVLVTAIDHFLTKEDVPCAVQSNESAAALGWNVL